jgi:hypothetical protein
MTTFNTRVTFDHVRNTAAGFTAANPVLGYGVTGLETDTGRIKVGDGVAAWAALPYLSGAAHQHPIGDVTGLQAALDAKATPAQVTAAVAAVVDAAPGTLDTLNELAAALGDDANFASTVTNALAAKAPLASPTFTGTVSGITKAMVGLGSVDNTADVAKPVSTATQTALDGKVSTTDARLTDARVPTDGSVTDAKIASAGLSTSSLNWAAIQPWAANTAYAKGDLVSFAGIAYRRSAAGTSGATFNTANWQQITPSNPVISVDGATGAVTVTKAETFDFTATSAPASATGANGSYSWVVPSNAKAMMLYAIGAGGGGGSGRRGASGAARFGGGGGASAGAIQLFFSSLDGIAGKTATIVVGAGGAGGAARTTDNTDGNNGSNGGVTSVTIDGRRVQAVQGLGAGGGTASSGSAGTSVAGMFRGNSGGNSSATGTPSLPQSLDHNGFTSAGASAGGGISTGDTSFNGGQVRGDTVYDAQNNAFTNTQGGVAPGGAGANGASLSFGTPLPGGSGSGGAAGNATTPGGNGGNGGAYGGGGGGGGASFNGYASGAGGNGGNGFVRFVVFY